MINNDLVDYVISDGEKFRHEPSWVGDERHDLILTDLQRQLAGNCLRVFIDGTHKPVPNHMKQLLTINGFVKAENNEILQVPLCFVFMSRRRKQDYVAVFNAFKKWLLTVNIEDVVSDFESAIWSAVQDCFPNARHYGCVFHFQQAVLRMARSLGLGSDYLSRGSSIRRTIQQLICLPYVPADKIVGVFNHIRGSAPDKLEPLFAYFFKTWLSENALWPPKCWSVFYKAIRTNNDLEGTHNRWTRRSKGHRGYYAILSLFAEEAARIPLSCTLLCHGKLKREQKRSTTLKQKFLFDLWDRYLKAEMTSLELVNECVDLQNSNLPRLADFYENDDDQV